MKMKGIIASFGYAFAGIGSFISTERNAKIHCLAAIVATALGFYCNIEGQEWLWVSLAITLVFVSEMVNTAIEKLCDKVSPEISPEIKFVKDVSAGFVLIAAFFSLVTAAIIFLPYLFNK